MRNSPSVTGPNKTLKRLAARYRPDPAGPVSGPRGGAGPW
jgi:hypothetical protein